MHILFKFFLVLISIAIITIPDFLLAGTITLYTCPDGSIYASDTGLPENLKNKDCKEGKSIKELETNIEWSCRNSYDELYKKASKDYVEYGQKLGDQVVLKFMINKQRTKS